ncbi:TetR/AcrR family transcriptional regulator [Panacagrimonas sp.]|uniref:TetR/AcrR family transcriptional regulator n=1 Tax=Panacagrimonas sp. TaxID=2480088 RepID=UPI003B521BFC
MNPSEKAAPTRRRYRGVDAGARQEERRRQFVEAGLECFGSRGYHAVTVRELCAQAQLTERYFYESFKDREALFAAVYADLIAHLRVDFMAAAAPHAPNLQAMARAGLEVFFRRLKKDPRVARMLMVEVLTVSQEMEQRAQEATFGFGDLLKQMTVAILPRGHAVAQDMDLIATGLIGACVHIAMRWTAGGYRQPVRRVIDASMTFFDALIVQLSRPPTP